MAAIKELSELFKDFALQCKAHGALGVCLILVPEKDIEGGKLADVQLEAAGGEELTEEVVLSMLHLAAYKVKTTTPEASVIKPAKSKMN